MPPGDADAVLGVPTRKLWQTLDDLIQVRTGFLQAGLARDIARVPGTGNLANSQN